MNAEHSPTVHPRNRNWNRFCFLFQGGTAPSQPEEVIKPSEGNHGAAQNLGNGGGDEF